MPNWAQSTTKYKSFRMPPKGATNKPQTKKRAVSKRPSSRTPREASKTAAHHKHQVSTSYFSEFGVSDSRSVFSALAVLLSCFLMASYALYSIVCTLPPTTLPLPQLSALLRPTADHVNMLQEVANFYLATHFYTIVTLFCGAYLLLQAFAIPGPVILSVLAGRLFGTPLGLVLVTFCTTLGSFLCRQLFYFVGKPIVSRLSGVEKFRAQVRNQREKGDLFWWFLFLRITPLLPNWFINVSSAHVHVPWTIFVAGTALGLLGNNFVFVSLGGFEFSWRRSGSLFLLGIVALIPVFVKRWFK